VQITYARNDQNGNPVIEGYNVNATQAYVENDPVTGQANMLRTSSGENSLYVYDGIGNPVGLLTDFSTSAYQYTYDSYRAPTLVQSSGVPGPGRTRTCSNAASKTAPLDSSNSAAAGTTPPPAPGPNKTPSTVRWIPPTPTASPTPAVTPSTVPTPPGRMSVATLTRKRRSGDTWAQV
jgi:hypothetical protein